MEGVFPAYVPARSPISAVLKQATAAQKRFHPEDQARAIAWRFLKQGRLKPL
jgi:hypothetical protein